MDAVKKAYETQAAAAWMYLPSRSARWSRSLFPEMIQTPPAVKWTRSNCRRDRRSQRHWENQTAAKLAKFVSGPVSGCAPRRLRYIPAAAIEQIKLWGQRLDVEVVAGAYGLMPRR